jgi:hypothetical protein
MQIFRTSAGDRVRALLAVGRPVGVSYQRLIHGLTRIGGHCLFAWTESLEPDPARTYEIATDHCEDCIAKLRALYPSATFVLTARSMSDVDEDANPAQTPRGPSGSGRK